MSTYRKFFINITPKIKRNLGIHNIYSNLFYTYSRSERTALTTLRYCLVSKDTTGHGIGYFIKYRSFFLYVN
jgi:hypothetical protein